MYDRRLERNLEGAKKPPRSSLCFDFFRRRFSFGYFIDIFLIPTLIDPIINGDISSRIFLYLVGETQIGYLIIAQNIVECRGANAQFFSYSPLLLIVALYPFCKLIHLILFLNFFFWKKIRYFDTFVTISKEGLYRKYL
jgi:hypothetical protein